MREAHNRARTLQRALEEASSTKERLHSTLAHQSEETSILRQTAIDLQYQLQARPIAHQTQMPQNADFNFDFTGVDTSMSHHMPSSAYGSTGELETNQSSGRPFWDGVSAGPAIDTIAVDSRMDSTSLSSVPPSMTSNDLQRMLASLGLS